MLELLIFLFEHYHFLDYHILENQVLEQHPHQKHTPHQKKIFFLLLKQLLLKRNFYHIWFNMYNVFICFCGKYLYS